MTTAKLRGKKTDPGRDPVCAFLPAVSGVIQLASWTLTCLCLGMLVLYGFEAPGNDQTIQFLDVTEQSGITFRHFSSPEKKFIVEVMSGGVALFDFDNDGWLDIYLTNSLTVETADQPQRAQSHLYRNQGDGTFINVTEKAGVGFPGWAMGVAAGDANHDGWLDLYVTCLGPNRLYINQQDGSFREMAEAAGVQDPRWSVGASFADYDKDGDQDLFVTNYVDFDLENLPQFGEGRWCQHRGMPVHCGPRGLPGAGDSLFRNEGDLRFSDVSVEMQVDDPEGRYGMTPVWTDVDGDGYLDLFVANDSGPNFLYINQQGNSFLESGFLSGLAVSEAGAEQGCMGVAVGDYDHDLKLDFFVTNFADEYNILYRHEKGSLFSDSSFTSGTAKSSFPYVGWGTEFFDYDNDGWLDLFAVNGHVYPQVDFVSVGESYRQPKLIYRNQGDGTFADVSSELGPAFMEKRSSRGTAVGDLDNDGDVDIVVNDLDEGPMVLQNQNGNRGQWIRVRLEGDAGERMGLNARIKVSSGDLVQISEVRSGGSYASQSDFRQHFGLGQHQRVDSIEVFWLDGTVSRLQAIESNQEVLIKKEQEGPNRTRLQ